MLALHKIELPQKDKTYLTKQFQNGDKIKYKDAVQLLVIDLDTAAFDEKKWTVSRPTQPVKDTESKITSKALSRLAYDQKSRTLSQIDQQSIKS